MEAQDGDHEAEKTRKPPAEECECEEGAPAWVVTFGDLMSLLLTFFVLLLSFSRMDQERFKELAGSLKEAFGVQRAVPAFDMPRGIDLVARDFNASFSAESLEHKIKATIKRLKKEVEEGEDESRPGVPSEGGSAAGDAADAAAALAGIEDALAELEDAVQVEEDAHGYVIRLDGAALFQSGGSEMRPEGTILLRALQPAVLSFGGDILVEGHTDDVLFAGQEAGVEDRNWQLSFERAHSVVRYLHQHLGIALDRIGVVARGPSRPLVSNATPDGRARNRRVEIVLLKPLDPEAVRVRTADASVRGVAGAEGAPALPPPASQTGATIIPETNFSPLESTGYDGEPASLFPD